MNWGILGYGKIAPVFIESLKSIGTEKIVAVASRSGAGNLKSTFPSARIYDNYDDLYADPKVDIIYISTTHNFHAQQSIKALSGKKHVLCEKPIGVNYDETVRIVDAAKKHGMFFMEALWTRFLPAYLKFKALLAEEVIGKIKLVKAEFAFRTESGNDERLLNPALAGGALLDIGVYPISLLNDIFQKLPEQLIVDTEASSTGVDLGFAAQMQYDQGVFAQVFCSLAVTTNNDVIIYGEEGSIRLDSSFRVQQVILNKGEEQKVFDLPYSSTGFVHEIKEVISCIKNKKQQSSTFSWDDSLMSSRLVDMVRHKMLIG